MSLNKKFAMTVVFENNETKPKFFSHSKTENVNLSYVDHQMSFSWVSSIQMIKIVATYVTYAFVALCLEF